MSSIELFKCFSGKHDYSDEEQALSCCNPKAKIAALFVTNPGPYYQVPNVDCWDVERDARLYQGPYPIVGHPPCARWSKLAFLVQATLGTRVGDDGGCFESAFNSVRKWGGIIEHPSGSMAYDHFSIQRPYKGAGWLRDKKNHAWVCEVDQGVYGNPLVKPTWLFYVGFGVEPPSLNWHRSYPKQKIQFEQHKRPYTTFELMVQRERSRTSIPFRDLLLSLARMVNRTSLWEER